MHISVVVPSYNSQDQLPDTLAALCRQQTGLSFEIVVVDCSSNDAVEKICAGYPRVKFHHESERFNPGKGRNIGAKRAEGELLVFVDSDVILEPDALDEAYRFYSLGKKIFGGALELNRDKGNGIAANLEHLFFNHESQRGRRVQKRSNLSSALMIFERDTFLRAGGFRDIPRMQDTELTERLRSQGLELYFTPAVVGLQTQDSSLTKVLRKIYINGKNLYFIRYEGRSLPVQALLGLGLPALTWVKVLRIIGRHLRYQDPSSKALTLALAPLLSLGGAYWMVGFYQSLLFGGGISQNRD